MDSKPPSLATVLIVSWSLWALVQYWLMSALHGTWRRLHEVEAPINYCYSFAVAVFMGFQLITILIGLIDLKWLAGKLSPIDKVAMYRKKSSELTNSRKMLIYDISMCYESPFFEDFVLCCFKWTIVELFLFPFTCSLVWDHLISYCSSTRSTADKGSSSSRRGGDRARANPAATGDKVRMYREESSDLTLRRKMLIYDISMCYEDFVWCCFEWAVVELFSFSFTCSLVWDHLISYCSWTRGAADKGGSSSRRFGDPARANPAATGDRDLEFGGTGNGDLVAVGGRDPGGGGGGGRAEGRRDPAMLAYWIALITLIITTVIGMLGLLAALRALGPNNFRDILNADSAIVVFGVLYVSGIITWIIWLLGAFQ